jgi:hypothetical protein
MEYFGTKLSIAIGGLRFRYVLALEDADDESPDRQLRAVGVSTVPADTMPLRMGRSSRS